MTAQQIGRRRVLGPIGLWTCVLLAGSARAEVQILQISDSSINSSSTQITDAGGVSGPGISDNLCVVNTAGGGVSIQVTSSGGAAGDGTSFRAVGTGGTTIRYRLSLFYADGSVGQLVSQTGQNVFTLPANRTAISTAACGLGNIKKVSILAEPLTPGSGSFSDSITFTVGPL